MHLVLYTHPDFLGSQSMPRFSQMLARGFAQRGHAVELRSPQARWHDRLPGGRWRKWGGYVDQYLHFPAEQRSRLRHDRADTLYVFCDQALGPWVPLVAERPHVVHCHDFMALGSALGELPENPTGFSGRLYQRYIRRGFRRARHFISISEHSRAELRRLGGVQPVTSEVVHNGLNHRYHAIEPSQAALTLQAGGWPADARGLLLHVGGGQWYKNTAGVLRLYGAYARAQVVPLPLWLVGPAPGAALRAELARLPAAAEVHFFQDVDNTALQAMYSLASALLFPSLAEGFGWPIAEALACGCPVLTTGVAPMTEVGGALAHYLPRWQAGSDLDAWAANGAQTLAALLDRPPAVRAAEAAAGIAWAARFDADAVIDAYLVIYERVLALELKRARGVTAEATDTAATAATADH